jgi:hypothetical protein
VVLPAGGFVDISNRSLAILLAITVLLIVGAGALTMRGTLAPLLGITQGEKPPEKPPSLLPLVTRDGGKDLHPEGPLVLTLVKGQQAPTATLACGRQPGKDVRVASDMEARGAAPYRSERPFYQGKLGWDSVPDGDCSVKLAGTETAYGPVFPGDELECEADQKKATRCTGGLAAAHSGIVAVASALPGSLEVDGDDFGHLPLPSLKLRVGKRALVVHLDDGRTLEWTLGVQPDERISVSFPSPDAPVTAAP